MPDSKDGAIRWQLRLTPEQPWYTNNGSATRTDRFAIPETGASAPQRLATPDDRHALYAMRYERFDHLVPWRAADLRRTLDLLASRGIALACFVTPVHDVLDAFLRETTPYMARLAEIQALAARHRPDALWLDAGDRHARWR